MPTAAVTGGFLLIVWGQYEVSRNPVHVPFHWPFLRGFNRWLQRDVYHTRNALAFALPLFFAGAAIVAALVPMPVSQRVERWKSRITVTRRRAAIVVSVLLPPLLIWGYLLLRLANHHYDRGYRWWMAAAVFWVLITLMVIDRADGRLSLPRIRWPHLLEVILVLALAGTFVGINARDLDNWRYSAIGDEGAFWDFGQRVIRGDPLNWFSQAGVYGNHPILSSVWQALVMRIFGSGLFGWKMASVLSIALTFPLFYWLLRQLLGVRVAAFGTLFLAASHYLFSYAHTGYENVFTLFPTTAALAFFVAGLRRTSYTLLFIAGFFAGLGWYTYYSSRSAIIMLAVAVVLMGRRGLRPEIAAAVGAGFLISAMPIFATNKYDVIRQMLLLSSSQTHQPFFDKITQNTPRTFLAFSFNPSNIHYVAGALMDSVSFTLAVAGVGVAIRGIRNDAYRLIVIWLLVGAVVSGLLSSYEFVSISRLNFLMPPMAALAGIGIDRLIAAAGWPAQRPSFERIVGVAAFAALAPLVFIINGQHFFIYSARHNPTTPETVVVRELTAKDCRQQPLRDIAYAPNPASLLNGLWRFFGMKNVPPLQIAFDDVTSAYGAYPPAGGIGCVAFISYDRPEVSSLVQRLQAGVFPGDVRTVTDLSGQARVAVMSAGIQRGDLRSEDITSAWSTDLTLGVGLDMVVKGQERDFVPSVDEPQFGTPNDVRMGPDEPVVVVTRGADERAYPLHTLLRRGPVNDTIGGVPAVITFDPIAGVARAYLRQLNGQTLSFGLTGLLRNGNALLYDRGSETWWQQLTGEAVTGALAGSKLRMLPAVVGTYGEFAAAFPDGKVLATDSDTTLRQGNPYLGYDAPDGKPIFTLAPVDARLAPMTRVAVIDLGSRRVALPFPDASKKVDRTYTLQADAGQVAIFFDARPLSLLDVKNPSDSRHVGTLAAFLRGDEDPPRTFSAIGSGVGHFIDGRNGTAWDVYGRAVDGPDKGAQLTPVPMFEGFWFSVSSLYPGIEIIQP